MNPTPRPETTARYFTPDRLGPWCVSCSVRLPKWMPGAGEHQHPTCSTEFRAAYAALKRSVARRALQAAQTDREDRSPTQ